MTSRGSHRWLRRQLDFLGSGRLAVVLLVASSVILCLYLFIPQRSQIGDEELFRWAQESGVWGRWFYAVGLTDLLDSWLFWGLYALLLVNLSVCMTRRLPLVLRRSRLPDRPPRPASGWLHRSVDAARLRPEHVSEQLRQHGYRTLVAEQTVYGLRGRFASIGHWVFHAGLLALLIAGGVVAGARDPFRATVGAGEGEPFDLHAARLVYANEAVDPEQPPLRFRLDRVDVRMEEGIVRSFDATLSTPEGERVEMAINRPHRSRPYQVLVHGFGYMPGWVIVNSRGRARNSAWLKLAPYPYEEDDSFSLGPPESTATVRFYPDHRREGEEDRTQSQELRNPRFRARVVWLGTEVYQGLLEPGERVELEEGTEFFFLTEIRKYGLLEVIEEQGQTPIFSCFAIMIAGLLIRYSRIRKEIVVELGERSLQLYGHGEIFENMFAEDLDRVAAELAKVSTAADGSGGTR
jgi:hypothetical protein